MNHEGIINSMNSKVALLKLDFFEKECKSCFDKKLQEKRKCAKLNCHNFLCCNKKGNFIKIKLKEEKEKIMQEFVSDLLFQHSQNVTQPPYPLKTHQNPLMHQNPIS